MELHGASGGVVLNNNGKVLIMFSEYIEVCDSNEANVLASYLEALRLFSRNFVVALLLKAFLLI